MNLAIYKALRGSGVEIGAAELDPHVSLLTRS
jgi:hypothetical protein